MFKAGAGQPVLEMGHITVNSEHLGSNSHRGWMFIRQYVVKRLEEDGRLKKM